jgi:signal transduction histidine kinase
LGVRAAPPHCRPTFGLPLGVKVVVTEDDLGVQLVAFRIVQEALTNALKHAGPRIPST